MKQVQQLLALSRLAALEAMRQPACVLLAVSSLVLTATVPMVLLHTLSEPGKLARDGGLAFHLVLGLFMTAYAASSTLSRELRTGTAAAVLTKPVGRDLFYLAKVLGLAPPILIFSLCSAIATLLAERVSEQPLAPGSAVPDVTDWLTGTLLLLAPFFALLVAGSINYRTRRPFGTLAFALLPVVLTAVLLIAGAFDRAGKPAAYALRVDLRLVPAHVLIACALGVFGSLALALSTRLKPAPTLVACAALLFLGLASDHLLGRFADQSSVAAVLHGIVPNWQHFWAADALIGGGEVSARYMLAAALYAAALGGAFAGLGLLLFRHGDVSRQHTG